MGIEEQGRFVHFPVSHREGRHDGETIAARLNRLERALGKRIAGWEVLRGFPPRPGVPGTVESWMLIFEEPVDLTKAATVLGNLATTTQLERPAGGPDGQRPILEADPL